MNKSLLRNIYLEKRNLLNEKEVMDFSNQILENLELMNIWEFQHYHLFQSIPGKNEVQTNKIQKKLQDLNKTIIVPKVDGKKLLSCQITNETEWIKGKFNVPEPKDCEIFSEDKIEIIFIPMVICDQKGNRIGYGGGFYDRFLSKCSTNAIKIGLSFFEPIKEIIDSEEFDIPLDYCVTPTEIVSFKAV